jgi:hypothetical protein
MVDISTLYKITRLWPARPSRPIEQFGLRKKTSQNQQRNSEHKDKNDADNTSCGQSIDEYV